MRLVKTTTVEPGTRLGKAIYNENGKIFVNKGVNLEKRILQRLIQLGITYIYIDDKLTEGIEYRDPISIQLKQEAVTTIKKTLKGLFQNRTRKVLYIGKVSQAISEDHSKYHG